MKMNSFINFNFYLTFFLECVLFMLIGDFAYHLSENMAIGILLCVVFILISIYYWGLFQGRKSPKRLPQPHRVIFGLLGFGVGALILYTNGKPVIALIFIIVAFINQLILYYYEKRQLKRQ